MSLHEPISIHEPVVAAPVKRRRRRLGVSWPTIILFAVVISYVNGFWVTTLQGAVGSLERSEPPFQRWLRDSSIMVVLYTAAVLVAVLLARRWFGRNPRALVRGGSGGGVDHRRVHLRGYRRGRQQRGLRLPPADPTHRTRRGLQPCPHRVRCTTSRHIVQGVCRYVRCEAIDPRTAHPSGHQSQRTDSGHHHAARRMAPRHRRRLTLAATPTRPHQRTTAITAQIAARTVATEHGRVCVRRVRAENSDR